MAEYMRVAAVSEIADPGKLLIEVNGELLALFHVGGKFYALDDVCTHDGGPLADGKLDGLTIACPRHGAKFDICTGKALTMPATRATRAHQVEVRGDAVYVKLAE
ncbi:MAG: non-heme iron oxygenase ferredoxin subunit [Pirellulales bacterium]|nr:non-heme iron oxygenase ferredoxin subunit [Pirellulales bacterium]